MAIDLKAVFRVQDKGSPQLRKLMKSMESLDKTSKSVTKATSSSSKAVKSLGSASASAAGGVSRLKSSMSGIVGTVAGVAGAVATATGAMKLFNETVGRAAQLETSTVAIEAIFNDKQASSAYMDLVKKMSIDSPVLSQNEMLSSSKGLIAMTKDVEQLGKAWKVAEKLMVLAPEQGTEGAAFALREMFSGDAVSLSDRFNISKKELNPIKNLSVPEQISELTKLLDKMGITDAAIEKMGQTSAASLNGVKERYEAFMQVVGGDGNKTMGKFYRRLSSIFDSDNATKFADKLGDSLNNVLTKAIEVGEFIWKWREPIAYAAGAVTAALGAFAFVGTMSALANPVTLIAAGIAATAVGFKALYDNSEPVRNVISGIVDKAKELIGAFQSGGAGGLLDALLPPGAAEAMSARFTAIREQLSMAFESIKSVVVPILTAAWGLISPILTALSTALKIVGDVAMIAWNNVLAPAIEFVGAAFTMMWGIVGPILGFLGAAIEAAFGVLRLVWDAVVGPFVAFLGGAFATAFGMATEVVGALTPVFETLGGWISKAAGYLREFADLIGKIKVPDWIGKVSSSAVGWAKNLVSGSSRGKNHYHGLANVPYDGYSARLHKNERVLTAQENREYSAAMEGGGFGGGITITGNQFTVREEADIEKIAHKLADLIEKERGQFA